MLTVRHSDCMLVKLVRSQGHTAMLAAVTSLVRNGFRRRKTAVGGVPPPTADRDQNVRLKTSLAPLVSPPTRLLASLWKTTAVALVVSTKV